MYSVTPKLGRIGFDDNPTTAIVLYCFRSSRIASELAGVLASELSGRRTLIAPQVHLCRRASESHAPWLTSICRSLPLCQWKCESLPESPSIRAAERSRPTSRGHRSTPSHPAPQP